LTRRLIMDLIRIIFRISSNPFFPSRAKLKDQRRLSTHPSHSELDRKQLTFTGLIVCFVTLVPFNVVLRSWYLCAVPKNMILRAVLLFSCVFWCVSSQAKQIAVVVDKANNQAEITSADLGKILALDTMQWKDGRKVRVIMRDPSDLEAALQKLLKMPEDKVKSLLAAHKGSFLVAKSDEELLDLVAANPGAIGLVDVYSINSKVAVLRVDSKLPLEQGYLLR
jgi:hypothetical protein